MFSKSAPYRQFFEFTFSPTVSAHQKNWTPYTSNIHELNRPKTSEKPLGNPEPFKNLSKTSGGFWRFFYFAWFYASSGGWCWVLSRQKQVLSCQKQVLSCQKPKKTGFELVKTVKKSYLRRTKRDSTWKTDGTMQQKIRRCNNPVERVK